jgi:hypothetical protein
MKMNLPRWVPIGILLMEAVLMIFGGLGNIYTDRILGKKKMSKVYKIIKLN